MKSINGRLLKCTSAFLVALLLVGNTMNTVASEGDYLETLNAGAAVVLEADISMDNAELVKITANQEAEKEIEKVEEESKIVMADVTNSVNVREEANEESDKIGKLYKDCGGELLERADGWSKIKSGEVVGWVSDEYLLFGREAESLASDVGHLLATVNADALRIRKDTTEDSGVYGFVAKNEKVDVIEQKDGWVAIDYEGNKGYISSEFVSVNFILDEGETMAAIQERERKEAEEKAKRSANRGAVAVGASDVELLGALIQCESGGESYEGQLAVGAVVMNRVRSGAYPNSVQGVIYASGQFTPALNGKVAVRVQNGIKPSCLQAAQEAINGASNIGGATHFRRAGSRDGIVIGNHVFW